MNQQELYKKIVECSKRNRNKLESLAQYAAHQHQNVQQKQKNIVNHYYQEYQQLLALNKETQHDNLNLKKEIAIADIQVEELNMKNNLSRSRIKVHSQQIQTLKGEYQHIEDQQAFVSFSQNYSLLNAEIIKLQAEIARLQQNFALKKSSHAKAQSKYQKLIQEKQNLILERQHKYSKNKARIDELQHQLREIRLQSTNLKTFKEKQGQKTKRQNKSDTLKQIRGILKRHKETYE